MNTSIIHSHYMESNSTLIKQMKSVNKYENLECLCIPGIDISYQTSYICKLFSKFGAIKYIAEIPLKANDKLKRVILYIVPKQDTREYQVLKQHFKEGANVKIFNDGGEDEKPVIWEVRPFDNRPTKFVETYLRKL
jgi:hypothetical protein